MTTATKPVALVTGASSGIGAAAARALITAGYEVIGTSRNASRVAAREGVTFLDLDVSSDDSVAAVVEQVIARFGRIDLLVNNAGMGAGGAAEESSLAQDQRLFDINVFGVLRMTKAVLPYMRAQHSGRIINISSIVGLIPAPYLAAYAATKHAIEGYSESLDHEVREHGIRVLLVEPGWTSTGFETNSVRPDNPLPVYARQRQIADQIMITAGQGRRRPRHRRPGRPHRRHRRQSQAALPRRSGRRTRQHAAPPRAGPRLRPLAAQARPVRQLTSTQHRKQTPS